MPNFMTPPRGPALFVDGSLFTTNGESSRSAFRGTEAGLRRRHEWLALQLRLSRHVGPPNEPQDQLHATTRFRAKGRRRLAKSQGGAGRHAARVSVVLLCR